MCYFILIAFLLGFYATSAQTARFEPFKTDMSQFPLVKQKGYLFDKSGKHIPEMPAGNLAIRENGVERVFKKATFPPAKPDEKISATIGINTSLMMSVGEKGFAPPVDIAKTFAKRFVQLSTAQDEFALQLCGDYADIYADFFASRTLLLNAIDSIKPAGGYNVWAQFGDYYSNAPSGMMQIAKEGAHKRVAILCTNTPVIDNTFQLKPLLDSCLRNNIRFYVVICSSDEGHRDIRTPLQEIAEATGGIIFDNITSVSEAEKVAVKLQAMARNEPFEIEWESAPMCDLRRDVTVEFAGDSIISRFTYISPQESLASLNISSPKIVLGGVRPGTFKDTTIFMTAVNSNMNIAEIRSSHSSFSILDFGGSSPPFILKENETRSIKIRFSATDSSRIAAAFTIENDICSNTIFVSGGYADQPVKDQTLRIVLPNGGEELAAGSDGYILWKGLPQGHSVKVDLTLDDGKHWKNITPKAELLRQPWRIPDTVSTQARIRVSHYKEDGLQWAKHIKGFTYESPTAITTDGAGHIYTCFRNTFSKYGSDGKILWEKEIFSPGPIMENIACDEDGNIYIAGIFGDGTTYFDNPYPDPEIPYFLNTTSSINIFIAKYNSSGKLLWVRKVEGRKIKKNLWNRLSVFSLHADDNKITVAGNFTSDSLAFDDGPMILKNNNNNTFIAEYDTSGNISHAKNLAIGNLICSSMTVQNNGNLTIAGDFYSDTLQFQYNINVFRTAGSSGSDVFVATFEPDGTAIWVRNPNGSNEDHAVSVTADSGGNVYVFGRFQSNNLDFGNGIRLGGNSGSTFIAKYDVEGTIIWARCLFGIDQEKSIIADRKGSIYICGNSNLGVNFDDGIRAGQKSSWYSDGVMARYDEAGNVQWVTAITGKNSEVINTIAVDPSGHLIAAGAFQSPVVIFSKNITLSNNNQGKFDFFLAKYTGTLPEYTDISDNVFTIGRSSLDIPHIDMGKVYVGSVKDSVINTFITNTGKYPIHIHSIQPSSSEFRFLSIPVPCMLQPGEKKAIGLRFAPTYPGFRSTTIRIFTQAGIYDQNIGGEALPAAFSRNGYNYMVRFGSVGIGAKKDTTYSAVLYNAGQNPVTVRTKITGPGADVFEVLNPDSIVIHAGQYKELQIRFKPTYPGRTTALITATSNGDDTQTLFTLFGRGLAGNAFIANDSGYNGEKRNIRIMLSNPETSIAQSIGVTGFRAKLAYSNHFFKANTALFKNGIVLKTYGDMDTVEIYVPYDFKNSEIAAIPIEIITGDPAMPEIHLISANLVDTAGRQLPLSSQNGLFAILGNISDGVLERENDFITTPNPIREIAEVTFTKVDAGAVHITIADVRGRRQTLLHADFQPGRHTWEWNTEDLTQGVYIITLEADGKTHVRKIIIER